jgi:D-glucosaminate-6-phosphate ammonia-lyase
MKTSSKLRHSRAALSRRDMFLSGGVMAARLAARAEAKSAMTNGAKPIPAPDVYTRLGVHPFINCTATLTINGGSLMMPEVISAVEQASYYHVNLDELMEKAGARLAELLQTQWGIVTNGTAAALTHATAACLAGTDPEKMQRLPSLEGLKNEVIMPRESRVVYDHAIRTLGVKIVEVNSPDELRAAISPHTAMVEVLGNYFGKAKLDLKDVAPIARNAGIPILVDAAADYLIVPNPYIAQGADMVAYSGGKILRGPQNAGLLIGRRDLVRAAWANSAPHHGFGRALKVSKEAVVGMLRAVEIWCTQQDVHKQFAEWQSWYARISEQITTVPGVRTEVRGPIRGGPFPTLNIAWDPAKIGLTAGELGNMLLNGKPRIMTHAEGEGFSFVIRPCALKPGDHEIVARRLYEIFSTAGPKTSAVTQLSKPVADISGTWDVDVHYEVGSARHKLFLAADGNRVTGFHEGWAYQGDLKGQIDGSEVKFRSSLPADGNVLSYTFTGSISDETISGDLTLGEYGRARWRAKRHSATS